MFNRIVGKRKLLKKYYFKLECKRSLRRILLLYFKCLFLSEESRVFKSNYLTVVYLLLPARQHRISLLNFITKDKHLSVGSILKSDNRWVKCLKRQSSIILSLMFFFKKFYSRKLSRIYLFRIKNFNYRQYCFFTMFLEQLKPSILYFVHKRSYIPQFFPKRRIKRQVLRSLDSE